jgi:hypothetical protein
MHLALHYTLDARARKGRTTDGVGGQRESRLVFVRSPLPASGHRQGEVPPLHPPTRLPHFPPHPHPPLHILLNLGTTTAPPSWSTPPSWPTASTDTSRPSRSSSSTARRYEPNQR